MISAFLGEEVVLTGAAAADSNMNGVTRGLM